MAKQDDYTRYTIRIPTPLYERVKAAAGDASVNSVIIATLEEKFPEPLDREAIMKVMRAMLDWLIENPDPNHWMGDVTYEATQHGLDPDHFTLETDENGYASVRYWDPVRDISMMTFCHLATEEDE